MENEGGDEDECVMKGVEREGGEEEEWGDNAERRMSGVLRWGGGG